MLLTFVILIIGALTFLPGLASGRSSSTSRREPVLMSVATTPKAENDRARDRSGRVRCSTRRSCGGPSSTAFVKLNPDTLLKNPVIFVVEVVSVVVTIRIVADIVSGGPIAFDAAIALGLWFTVLFANFAEAMAEGRGKAQADALRRTRADLVARRLARATGARRRSRPRSCGPATSSWSSAGELIPGDGEIVEGIASVDESAITGESAPVIRESGGDRSAVTAGTKVLSDWIKVRITADPGQSFLDRMIALVEGAERQKTPNEIALSILLAKFTIIFLIVVRGAAAVRHLLGRPPLRRRPDRALRLPDPDDDRRPALGDRHRRHGPARPAQRPGDERPGRRGGRRRLHPAPGQDRHDHPRQPPGGRASSRLPAWTERELAEVAQLASLADETPEGRSIVVLAKERFGIRERELMETRATFIPFTAQTRMSGVDVDGNEIRKGAVDAIVGWSGRELPPELAAEVERIARAGGTPLAVARGPDAARRRSSSRTSSRRAWSSASPSSGRWASAP